MALNTTIALTTVEAVELALGLECNVYTLQIENLINMYSALLEALTGRRLKSRVYTNYRLDGHGGNELFFDQYPVTAVTGLSIYDSTNILYQTVNTANLADFVVHGQIGKLYLPGDTFIQGEGNVVFSGTAGITDASELALLEMAVIALIAQNSPVLPWGSTNRYKSERIGSYQYVLASTASGYPMEVDIAIAHFSRI